MVYTIVAAGLALIGGFAISYMLLHLFLRKKRQSIIREAESEAEVIRKDKILQAKEKFLTLKTEHEKVINETNNRLIQFETRLKQKETAVSQRMEEFQRKKNEIDAIRNNLTGQLELVEKRTEELDKMHKNQIERLENISGMSADEAKNQLIENLKAEA
ncbi:MAG TPA: Rnase Y domain-containing protein, partial [Williamwhitmania sp.]|nr:Rnase Y domain-containing protein [Williamwhitmania sp.]